MSIIPQSENWKALLSLVSAFGAQLFTRLMVDGLPVLPTKLNQWLALAGGSLLAAVIVWVKENNYTVEELQKKLDKQLNAGN